MGEVDDNLSRYKVGHKPDMPACGNANHIMYLRIKSVSLLLVAAVITTGCATAPPQKPPVPGLVIVEQNPPTDGDYAKVRLITASRLIQKNTLSVLTLVPRVVLGGGGPVYHDKTQAYGELLMTVDGKTVSNSLNDGSLLAASIQASVNEFVKNSPAHRERIYKRKIRFSPGISRLIYDSLTGPNSEKYRLHVTMGAHKTVEVAPSLKDMPSAIFKSMSGEGNAGYVVVNCDHVSPEPLGLAQWAENDYALLKQGMSDAGEACVQKMARALPELLSR